MIAHPCNPQEQRGHRIYMDLPCNRYLMMMHSTGVAVLSWGILSRREHFVIHADPLKAKEVASQ